MGLDREVLASRLARLDEYLSVLDELALTELESLAGFRNRLVHDYFRLDRPRVHLFIRTRLDGFRLFAADVARWLDSSPRAGST